MKKIIASYVGVAILFVAGVCLAASSTQMINYQGRLADTGGSPINGSTVSVIFSIYTTASGDTVLWTETQSIVVTGGLYNVKLGEVNPITDNLFSASDRWLGVQVRTDPEMVPRAQITSVAYAINSQRIAGKKIQSGQSTLTIASAAASGPVSVTFPAPFAVAPQVITGALSDQVGGKTFIVEKVDTITTTGCVVTFTSLDGSTTVGSANFDWIAIGE
jgi:H-type lectin domain